MFRILVLETLRAAIVPLSGAIFFGLSACFTSMPLSQRRFARAMSQ